MVILEDSVEYYGRFEVEQLARAPNICSLYWGVRMSLYSKVTDVRTRLSVIEAQLCRTRQKCVGTDSKDRNSLAEYEINVIYN